jgi:hypothetical protein
MMVTIISLLYKTEVHMKNTQELRTLTLEEIEMVNGAGLVGNVVSGLNGVVNSVGALPLEVIENAYSVGREQVRKLVDAVL